MKQNLFEIFQAHQRISEWALKFVISLMMICLAISVMQFGNRLSSDLSWNGWYLPIAAWLLSLEAMATRNKERELEPGARFLYHLSEWVIIAVLLKVVHYLIVGPSQIWVDLPLWRQNPADFFTGDYLPALVVLFLTWLLTGSLNNDLEEMQIDPTDIKWESGKLENSRQAARQRMAQKIFAAGGIMVFITMLTRLDLRQLWGETPASTASIANVSVYFFLTLVFLSGTQFSFLRGTWFWNQTLISPEISKNWIKYSLIFFAVLAAISFILPTRYTFGFLEVLQFILTTLFQIVAFIFNLLAFPCGLILSLLKLRPNESGENPQLELPRLNLEQPAGPPLAWWELVKSILFWAIFVGIVSFAFVNFLRQHPGFARALGRIPGFGWLATALKTFWQWISGINKHIALTLTHGWQRIFRSAPKSITRSIGQLINFKQLSARQQVVFYYLRLLDRSKKSGIDRKPHQTPDQFASNLEQVIPEVQQEIHHLTETFVEARYSNHVIGSQHTSTVQQLWRRIVRNLKPKKSTD